MLIGPYSFGIGDRFGLQGEFLLQAFIEAKKSGVLLTPVWNKSFREHTLIQTRPVSIRKQAEIAVKKTGWTGPYFVDADHINQRNIETFLDPSDFFTIDVADYIGKPAERSDLNNFIERNKKYTGSKAIPGSGENANITQSFLEATSQKFVLAAREAAIIYKTIEQYKGKENFVAEVSFDEADQAQSPLELYFILEALFYEGVQLQTIAPKFSGEFHKGIDYIGDPDRFEKEFEQHLLVIDESIARFGLPGNLKLSVHSGSDKFSIYPAINRMIKKHKKGLHVKTAGTTWLEELAGLIISGNQGLEFAKEIYSEAYQRRDELIAPYKTVTSINEKKLNNPGEVNGWDKDHFAGTIIHDSKNPYYNTDMRQLMHLAYKVAAEKKDIFEKSIKTNQVTIGNMVFNNIFNRHIKPLFID